MCVAWSPRAAENWRARPEEIDWGAGEKHFFRYTYMYNDYKQRVHTGIPIYA